MSEATPSWVAAAPCRQHLHYLSWATGVQWPALAVHAGVSTELVRHLLFGRCGRRVKRVSPATARRLLGLELTDVSGLQYRLVPAASTSKLIAKLVSQGLDLGVLVSQWGLDASEYEAIDKQAQCSKLTELLVLAAVRQVPTLLDEAGAESQPNQSQLTTVPQALVPQDEVDSDEVDSENPAKPPPTALRNGAFR